MGELPMPSLPSDALSDSARWSGRSEEMRILAEEMQDTEMRAMMFRLAADYEHMAARADEGHAASAEPLDRRSNKALKSPG